MLSQRTRYTIRALLHLADRYGEGPVQLAEIAQAQNIPPKFLTVMLSQTIRQGLVASRRGRDGGYLLGRAPGGISYGDIVPLTPGPPRPLPRARRFSPQSLRPCVPREE